MTREGREQPGAFVSTLASNGSSVTPPALEFLGLPEYVANGTNRLSVVALGSAYLAAQLVSSTRAKVRVYRFFVVLSIICLLMVDSTQFPQHAQSGQLSQTAASGFRILFLQSESRARGPDLKGSTDSSRSVTVPILPLTN